MVYPWLSQTFPEITIEGKVPFSFYEIYMTKISKLDKDSTQKKYKSTSQHQKLRCMKSYW